MAIFILLRMLNDSSMSHSMDAVLFSLLDLITLFSEESNARENRADRFKIADRVLVFENSSEDDKNKSKEILELQWKHFKGYDISSSQSAIGTQRYQSLMSNLFLPFFNNNCLPDLMLNSWKMLPLK